MPSEARAEDPRAAGTGLRITEGPFQVEGRLPLPPHLTLVTKTTSEAKVPTGRFPHVCTLGPGELHIPSHVSPRWHELPTKAASFPVQIAIQCQGYFAKCPQYRPSATGREQTETTSALWASWTIWRINCDAQVLC